MINEQVLKLVSTNPEKLFLFDGLGAILSAFLLGVVLAQLEWFFGIPRSSLYILALLPCLFAVYDFICYQKKDKNLSKSLTVIAVMNLLYCCLSIGFAFYHIKEISSFGWVYIIVEVLIIIAIASIELTVAKRLR